MSMLKIVKPDYKDGMTKQAFKDETDINKLLSRAQKQGTLSHLAQHEHRYGDFSDFDFFDAQVKLTAGREIFDALPSELRSEFHNSPAEFFEFVNDPDNRDQLEQKLPLLAAPGRQMLDVSGKTPPSDKAEPPLADAAPPPQVDPPDTPSS